jgi:hypothetical protein
LKTLTLVAQVEYKTKWAAPLQDFPGYLQRNDRRNISERQSMDTLHQLYGYMMFNENKYGILNNIQYAWFFQRVETADFEGRTLQYYGPINIDADSAPSLRACSKLLSASFCSPKLNLPGFTLLCVPAKDPTADTLAHLSQLLVIETWPLHRHSLATRLPWLDHIQSCHSILDFAVPSAVLCTILPNEVVP